MPGGFVLALRTYCDGPRNAKLSEHDHYGPYVYLKVMTWSVAGIDGNSIHGAHQWLGRNVSQTQKSTQGLQRRDVPDRHSRPLS